MRASASENRKNTEKKVQTEDLQPFIDEWLLDGKVRQHTAKTLSGRIYVMQKFLWYLDNFKISEVGAHELKVFFVYLSEPHPSGRWGNPKLTEAFKPVSSHKYYRDLKALFSYLHDEELIEYNPAKRLKPPIVRQEAKQPISKEHLEKLLKAAKQSPHAKRDYALLLLLLDSGLRAAEACSLKVNDVDLETKAMRVLGKGNKFRTVFLGNSAMKALIVYLRLRAKSAGQNTTLFLSHKNTPLGVSGIYQITKRLSHNAKIPNPGIHAFRRTFAVSMLREGANVFVVQALMGHSDLETTKKYVAIAQTDLKEQHQLFSPADRIKL